MLHGDELNWLLKEYELSQEMHNYYGRLVWEIGSIYLGGGFAAAALIVSRVEMPSFVAALLLWAISGFMITYYFMVRRYRDIAEIHLRRCREIEAILGLQQHRYVRRGMECSGVTIADETLPGKTDQPIKVPAPLGWTLVKFALCILMLATLVLGILYVLPYAFPNLTVLHTILPVCSF